MLACDCGREPHHSMQNEHGSVGSSAERKLCQAAHPLSRGLDPVPNMPFAQVPELTRRPDIKLNNRVLLRHHSPTLSSEPER